jgi:tRNA pseudouridine38-40 synthase
MLTRLDRFHVFFHQIDSFRSTSFLWVTAGGIEAAGVRVGKDDESSKALQAVLGDEDEQDPENGEG